MSRLEVGDNGTGTADVEGSGAYFSINWHLVDLLRDVTFHLGLNLPILDLGSFFLHKLHSSSRQP